MKKILFTALLALALSAPAFAHPYPGHGHPGYGEGGGYDHGFLDGLLASSAMLFTSDVTAHDYKEMIYVGAADEAAQFLANGTEPSALLRQAMDTERSFLRDSAKVDTSNLSDEDMAYLVIGRVEQLNAR